jgi:hypothetical protein
MITIPPSSAALKPHIELSEPYYHIECPRGASNNIEITESHTNPFHAVTLVIDISISVEAINQVGDEHVVLFL